MVTDNKIPDGYKQSEVGVIPEDWEVRNLNEISQIDSDNLGSNTSPDYTFKYISLEDVKQGVLTGCTEHSFFSSPSRARRRVNNGDMLFGTVRPNLKSHLFINEDVKDLICSTGFSVIRVKSYEYNPRYVYFHLFAKPIECQINSLIAGSNYPAVSSKDIRSLVIPLPPLHEQTAIANVLSDVDSVITSLDKVIAKKKDIKQGAMQELLTGKKRLPGFSGEWKTDNVKSLASITTGAKNTQDRIDDGAYPFYVRSSIVERINSYSFDGEAVLTAGDGVGTGKVFHYINGKFDFHQRVYKISDFSERLDGYFFYLYFSSNFLNRIMQMTAKSSVDSVRMEMIADMTVPLPPLPEQTSIAQILSDMDKGINQLEQKRDKYKDLKQAMMQQLLTGKIRLV